MAASLNVDSASASPAKKMKLDHGDKLDSSENGSSPEHRFSNFSFKRVLTENAKCKTVCVEGSFDGNDSPAVVIMEKSPFNLDSATAILTGNSKTKVDIQNDIYGTFQVMPPSDLNAIKTTLIYPATQKHIDKYTAQDLYLIDETAQDYKNITIPYIEAEQFQIQWVYNILEKKQEAERIVFEDADPETGFILLPDMKWDCKQTEDLYLVAIIHKHGIKSIRDLTTEHLPLLKNIYDKGLSAIEDKYQVPKSKLRIYLHYQPSYYHLHIHFTHLKYEAPGSGVERAHLLRDVIENIEKMPDFYQEKTLSFIVKANQGLCKKYLEAGRI